MPDFKLEVTRLVGSARASALSHPDGEFDKLCISIRVQIRPYKNRIHLPPGLALLPGLKHCQLSNDSVFAESLYSEPKRSRP
jgi:hypothetical protein